MKKRLLLLWWLIGVGAVFAADDVSECTATSEVGVRVDTRTSVGGRIIHGEERISPMAENENANARLSVNGAPADGWTVGKPQYDSTVKRDGWYGFSLNEGKTAAEANLLVLNDDDVEIHGGALTSNEAWAAGKIHVVRNWVRIPEGRTLTIKENAVVKFCENTGIQVDGTIKANNAVFTSIADDTAGGDTDMNGETADVGYGLYEITGSGVKTLTNCDIRYSASLPENTTWASGKVVHVMGVLRVPSGVTLKIQSGTVVKFATGAELKADGGSIQASGAIFTHIADDTAGGDTNGDGDATSPVHDKYKLTDFDYSNCELRYITLTFDKYYNISGKQTVPGKRVYKVEMNVTIGNNCKLIIQPGTILKMSSGVTITVQSGGTLEAIGNRAQPIVFTSIKDDTHGGDTNGDGYSVAEEGAWKGIITNGTVTMDYCSLLYAGAGQYNNQGDASLRCNGGTTIVSNSEISHSPLRLVNANGYVTLANCLLNDARYGIQGNATVVNSVITKCTEYTLSGNSTIQNTIFYNTANVTGGTISSSCFWMAGNAPANKNNIQKDPLFTDPANGDFTLKAGSPCIDAGDGTVAPEFDYWGTPRADDEAITDTGKASANGCVPDIGIYERAVNADSNVDLRADSISMQPSSATPGDTVAVTWKVTNIGEDTAYGPWRDAVYLVNADETVEQSVLLAAPVAGMQLAGGKSNTFTANVTLPAVPEGNWRLKVQVNPNRDVFEGRLVENNTAVSSSLLSVGITGSAWSDGVSGNLKSGAVLVRKLKVSSTANLLGTVKGPKGATILYGVGYMPTASQNSGSVTIDTEGNAFLGLQPSSQDVYLVVSANGEGGNLSITFEEGKMMLTALHPAEVPKEGTVTFAIWGAGLPKYEGNVELVASNGSVRKAAKTYPVKPEGMFATFELDGLAPGKYTVRVTNNDEETALTAAIPEGVIVKDEKARKQLSAKLVLPSSVRAGRSATVGIEYVNQGNVDMPAPVFTLESSQLVFKQLDGTEHDGKVKVIGLSSEFVVGILRPGVKTRMDVPMQVKTDVTGSLNCKLLTSSEDGRNAGNAYPLGDLLNAAWLINPSSEEDVEKIAMIRTMVGDTWGEFYANLASFATTYVMDYNVYDNGYESLKSAFAAYVTGTVSDMMAAKTRGGGTRAGGWAEPPLVDDPVCSARDDYLHRTMDLEYDYDGINWQGDWIPSSGQLALRRRTDRHERMLLGDNSEAGNIWIYHHACGWWHRVPAYEEDDDLGLVKKNAPTIVIVHGNLHSIHTPWVYAMARAWHDKEPNANIVAVDWGDTSTSGVFSRSVKTATNIVSYGMPAVQIIAGGVLCATGAGAAAGGRLIVQGLVGLGLNLIPVDVPTSMERFDLGVSAATNSGNLLSYAGNPEFAWTTAYALPLVAREAYLEMIRSKLPLSNVTLIGHSHGGHVAGLIAGRLADNPYEPKPRRLIGLETSSMAAHFANLGDKFPNSWNHGSAEQTEFYKTSHMMSMGSDNREELWADYNFLVVEKNGDFVYQPGVHLMDNGFLNADNREGRLGSERHDYAPAWFIDTIINKNKWHGLGYAWEGDKTWREMVLDDDHDVPSSGGGASYQGCFAGVINGETRKLEGLDDLMAAEWGGDAYGGAWNYMDQGWRQQVREHSENLRAFYGWHAAMQSYRLNDADIPSEFHTGDEEEVSLEVENISDNTSVPYEEYWQHNGDGTYREEEAFMPWREERPLANECWLVDVREAGEGANFTKADISYLYSLPCYRVWQKKVESLDDFLLPGKKDTSDLKWELPDEGVDGFHTDRKLGCDKNGEPLEDGEWFALVTLCGVPASKKEVNAMPSVNRNTAFRTDNWWGDLDRLDGVDVRMIKVYAGDKPFARLSVQGRRVENDGWGPSVKANKNHVCTIQVDATKSKAVSPNKLKDYEWSVWESGVSYGPHLQIGPAPSSGSKTGTIQVTILEGSEGGRITIRLLVRDDKKNEKWTVAHVNLIQNNDEDGDETDNSNAWPIPTFVVRSWDPNEIAGPKGFGDDEGAENPLRYVIPDEELEFTIYFENKHEATGAAQEIKVNTYLSPHLDVETFRMVEVGLRNQVDMSLSGVADGSTVFDLEGTDYKAGVTVSVDKATGLVSWYLRVIDPVTTDGWPADDADGLLLPNDPPDTPEDERTHRGEGHLTYRVRVRGNAAHGGLVATSANIWFDYNEVIVTDPSWSNTIWAQAPYTPDTPTPADGATVLLDDIRRLSWRRTDGAASYDVKLWKDEGGTRTLVDSVEGLSVAYWTLPVKLEDKTRYAWQVTAVNPIGKTEGPLWTFRVSSTITETQTLELLKGWNWVGFSVLPEDRKISSVLGVNGFSVNDMVVDEEDSTTFNGTNWIPSNFTMDYGRMYNIYVSKRSTVEVTGLPGEAKAVTVYKGWNWLANPSDRAVTPAELVHSAGFQANDCIQGEEDSVTFNGQKWIPSTGFLLEPGKGYKIYTGKAGTLSFGEGK